MQGTPQLVNLHGIGECGPQRVELGFEIEPGEVEVRELLLETALKGLQLVESLLDRDPNRQNRGPSAGTAGVAPARVADRVAPGARHHDVVHAHLVSTRERLQIEGDPQAPLPAQQHHRLDEILPEALFHLPRPAALTKVEDVSNREVVDGERGVPSLLQAHLGSTFLPTQLIERTGLDVVVLRRGQAGEQQQDESLHRWRLLGPQ